MSRLLRRFAAPTSPRRRPIAPNVRLVLRTLEDRIVPATFTVINSGDAGAGSGSSGDLRYCVAQANATPGPNTVNYAAGVTGTTLSSPFSELDINKDLTLNGGGTAGLILGGGTLAVGPGATLTLNALRVTGGYLDGSGTIATDPTNGAKFASVTVSQSLKFVSASPADQFNNIDNSSHLTVAANTNAATSVAISGFNNEGAGTITVGANSHASVVNFQTSGVLTLTPGTTGTTELTNAGASPLLFNGGSRTFVSDILNAPSLNAGIDLNGQNAMIGAGLLVNNGFISDSSNGGTGTHKVIAGTGSLVMGAGYYQNTVLTPGGAFEPGNGPGAATFGSFDFSGSTGNTGVSGMVWQINDAGTSSSYPAATGTAGPTANAALQVSGWGLVKTGVTLYQSGNFSFDATPTDRLTFAVQSVPASNDVNGNPIAGGTYSTASTNTYATGPMAQFDPSLPYTWPVVTFQGAYTGPTDSATLNASTIFNLGSFVGAQPGSTFGWVLVPNTGSGGQLDLVYTPPSVGNNPPAAPNTPTAVATAFNSITVTWAAVPGATNYELERAPSTIGPWTQSYYGSALSYTDNAVFPNTTYYYRLSASNASGISPYSGIATVTTPHNPTTTVASVVVNDGSAQRSEVRSITVTFSGGVSFAGGNANAAAAFQLTNVADSNTVALASAVSTDSQGRTVVTLTFSGTETDAVSSQNGGAPSLIDGRYTLTIFAADVTGPGPLNLDGDGDGNPGGNYVSPTDTLGGGPGQLHLYRIFGDATGDGIIDQQDLGQFRGTFNVGTGNPLYLAFLDADNNGIVDQVDLSQFRGRFNTNVF